MKSLKKNSYILLILTILILFAVMKDDFNSILDSLLTANVFFLILALLCQLSAIFFEAIAYKKVVNGYQKDYSFEKALKMQFMTKFFNGITPFSTGGQPMQIYVLKKEGFRLTKATNIIMQNFIIYQAALVLYGLLALGINAKFHLFKDVPVLKELIALGFLMNTLVMIGLIIVSFSSKFNHAIIDKSIHLLGKWKLIKNPEQTKEKWSERIDDFHEGTMYLKENKRMGLEAFIFNFLYLTFNYLMPYFVILALGSNAVTPLNAIVSSAYILIIGSFVPIPGASGGIEFGYLMFFGTFITGGILKASLLIWRFISYYLLMIIGAIAFNIKGSVKKCE
ncbi:MAG: flippase-like domain-containing protein [Firmicutes bacterium]|nr:flippase-like domain-containing protein [Bacillota bacterium]